MPAHGEYSINSLQHPPIIRGHALVSQEKSNSAEEPSGNVC